MRAEHTEVTLEEAVGEGRRSSKGAGVQGEGVHWSRKGGARERKMVEWQVLEGGCTVHGCARYPQLGLRARVTTQGRQFVVSG